MLPEQMYALKAVRSTESLLLTGIHAEECWTGSMDREGHSREDGQSCQSLRRSCCGQKHCLYLTFQNIKTLIILVTQKPSWKDKLAKPTAVSSINPPERKNRYRMIDGS